MNRHPKIIARITNEPASLREAVGGTMKHLALALLCIALCGCGTLRKAICPPAHVSTVTETEHAYIVTVEAECKTITEKVPK